MKKKFKFNYGQYLILQEFSDFNAERFLEGLKFTEKILSNNLDNVTYEINRRCKIKNVYVGTLLTDEEKKVINYKNTQHILKKFTKATKTKDINLEKEN